jgi:acetyl esterase/lipase
VVPGETAPIPPETLEPSKPGTKPIKIMSNVSHPTLTVFPAPKEKNTGTAVVIAPGGGYNILAWDLEGTEVADWLNSIGVTGIVLKYRVPRRPGMPGDAQKGPLQDAQRAMSLVRSRAKEWHIDPNRIGMLGFSAGGHLTASTETNSDRRSYEAIDAVDQVSCRPDFAVLVYPAYLIGKDGALNPEIRIDSNTPPTFFAHAGDDPISCENSVQAYLAMRKAKVPAELHVFAWGGHGFGLRPADAPDWTRACEQWMRRRGLLGK